MKKNIIFYMSITILLLFTFSNLIFAMPSFEILPEPVPTHTCNTGVIINIIRWGSLILFPVIPIIEIIILNKKNKNLELSDEEKEIKCKGNIKKFIIELLICGIIGFSIYTVLTWMTDFAAKPIIYLYPEKEEYIEVKLGKVENLTCTYPKYNDGWEIIAKPNGDLVDVENNRNLYALYWEGINDEKVDFEDGFCVKGEDTISFLEEKLEILGLTEREANEFIVYWLPRLENNKYNIIRFATMEEINKNMPLEITPTPDTIIRVMMQFKGVSKYKEIKEQELITPERNGFVAVEWGGTEVK